MQSPEDRALTAAVIALAYTCRDQLGLSLDDWIVRLMASCQMLEEAGDQDAATAIRQVF